MFVMITVNGKPYSTIIDAAKAFGVSAKTLRSYIHRGILETPPVLTQGLRCVFHFPEDYMKRNKQKLEGYTKHKMKEKQQRNSVTVRN